MAGNIKGIVVEIGGDTSGLQTALKNVSKTTSSLQKELNGINTLLKFNPRNTELLAQKQVVLNKEIASTTNYLQNLIKHQNDVKNSGVQLTEEQEKNYRNLQREIIATTNKLQGLLAEQSKFTSFGHSLQNIGENMRNFGDKVSEVGQKLNVLSGALASLGVIGVKFNAEIERSTMALGTFLGSAEAGEEAVKNIMETSKNSPFDTKSLIKANQLLITTGVSADDSAKTINALADAVALSGGDNYTLERMASNLQQIQNVGKASSVDIRQFGMAGINIYKVLSDYTGKTTEQVKEMDITYEDLSKALQKASSEGGLYYKGQEAMMDTLLGKLSKLKKSFTESLGKLVESLMPTIEKVVDKFQQFVDWFSNLDQTQKDMILKVGLFLVALGPVVTILGKIIGIGGTIIGGLGTLFVWFGKIKAGITALGVVLGLPLGTIALVVAAIGGLIGVFVLLYNKCEWFRNGVNAIVDFIKEKVLGFINTIGTFFTETIPNWINTIQMILDNLPYYIGYLIGLIIAHIINFVNRLWTFVRDELPVIIQNIIEWFNKLPSLIWDIFVKIVMALGDWATDMINKAKEVVPQIVDKIREFFDELPGKLKEIGIRAIEGLINGIIEKWNNAKETVVNFAHGIRDAIANALDIHSPSRVMRDFIGKNIVLGIEQGFTDQMTKSIPNMQNSLTSGLGDLSLEGVGARGNNITLNFYPQEMTEQELDKAFKYVDRRLGLAL